MIDKKAVFQDKDFEKAQQVISEAIRHASLIRLNSQAQREDFELVEMDAQCKSGRVLENWLTLIMINGDPLKIVFHVHFSLNSSKKLVRSIFKIEPEKAIEDRKAIDFMKEYCNLVAGYVIHAFNQNSLTFGNSLPLSMRGFYEVFNDFKEKDQALKQFFDCWILSNQEMDIYCSVKANIMQLEKLKDISSLFIEEDSEEGFDFL